MSYILTVSGKHFEPVDNPDIEMIGMEDIAHSLSHICRANGHVKHFYSVAQHSIACAKEAKLRGYSPEVQLACLLHDGSEAYLSDVTRPIKHELTRYLEVEDVLQNLVWKRFLGRDIYVPETVQVFEVDDDILSLEFHYLMKEEVNDNYKKVLLDWDCPYQDPREVKKEFLELGERLLKEVTDGK